MSKIPCAWCRWPCKDRCHIEETEREDYLAEKMEETP